MRLFTPPVVAAILLGLVAVSLAAPKPQDAEYYDEEEEAPPPPPSTPAPSPRGSLNRNRGASAALRKPTAKKATESTPAPPPPPPPSPETSEEQAETDTQDETTTEAPKKYLIAGRNGVVRPFRSHEELLAALKRRRQQGSRAVSTHAPPATDEPTAATPARQSKSQRAPANLNSNNKRGRFGSTPRVTEAPQEVQEVQQPRRSSPPAFARRPGASRRVQEETPAAADEAEETHSEELTQRTNRFSPRRRS